MRSKGHLDSVGVEGTVACGAGLARYVHEQHVSVNLVIVAADRPWLVPRNCVNAGPTELEKPCRYSSGSTSATRGDLRARAGRIAEANRFRSPVAGSVRLSFDPRRPREGAPLHVTLPKTIHRFDHCSVDANGRHWGRGQ